MKRRTRLAPTPSGYLHAGNAWSFALTWLLARSRGGSIHLRIDDLDTARLRPEYLEDIFASLAWLGIDWDTGPRSPEDFLAHHSQRLRLGRYREALDRLMAQPPGPDGLPAVFACACSREQVKRAAAVPGIYPGTCRALRLNPTTEGMALRMHVPEAETVEARDTVAGTLRLAPGRETGDFVVRQKNGDPAYQLASVVDDEDLDLDLIVRGRDLLTSTGAQLALARRLGATGFPAAEFLHHGLLVRGSSGEDGKLSKSSMGAGGALVPPEGPGRPDETSLKALRARFGSPAPILRFFAGLLGQPSRAVETFADLLDGFDPARIPLKPIPWELFPGH